MSSFGVPKDYGSYNKTEKGLKSQVFFYETKPLGITSRENIDYIFYFGKFGCFGL